MQIGLKVRLSIEFVLELGLGFVVAAACRPLVLTMSLISYVLNGDTNTYGDSDVISFHIHTSGFSPPSCGQNS